MGIVYFELPTIIKHDKEMETMKTRFTRPLSIALCIAILMSTLAFSASAGGLATSDSQWAAYWNEYVGDGKAVYLAPGGDDTEMRFAWMSEVNVSRPIVRLSSSASMSNSTTFIGGYVASTGPGDGYSAHVEATELEAGAKYYYQCGTVGNMTPVNSFKTVEKGGDFSAIYVSDLHISGDDLYAESIINGSKGLSDIFTAAVEKDDQIALIVSGGDQANSARVPEYAALFAAPVLKTIPFALTVGNHDSKYLNYKYIANNPNMYQNAIAPSLFGGNYWFVKGDVLFLMLDTNNPSPTDHYNFMQQAIDANPGVKWRIATFHHDLYGGHKPSRESEAKLLRIMLTPIFDKFAIDLVLMGHSHVYSRSHVLYGNKISQNLDNCSSVKDPKGSIYFVSGSTGNPRDAEQGASEFIAFDHPSTQDRIYNIINFSADKLTIRSYIAGNDEQAMDTFTIEKTGDMGGHPENDVPFWYGFIQKLGTFVSVVTNFTKSIGYLFEK